MADSEQRKPTQAEKLASDYAEVFGSEVGKRVLHDLLTHARVLDSSYEPGDPYGTHFHEGRRSLALHILTMMRMNEPDYHKLFMQQPLIGMEEF
ncbi:MAG TPA: hypothetical protein VKA19_02415 [Alphaproteobacteria bacterium]|nr:hypothetical protein [Alphaproteobacteria bacterium]